MEKTKLQDLYSLIGTNGPRARTGLSPLIEYDNLQSLTSLIKTNFPSKPNPASRQPDLIKSTRKLGFGFGSNPSAISEFGSDPELDRLVELARALGLDRTNPEKNPTPLKSGPQSEGSGEIDVEDFNNYCPNSYFPHLITLPDGFYFTRLQTVLLAEDSEEEYQTLLQNLERWGLSVQGARTAEEALLLYHPGRFDVLIFDQHYDLRFGKKLGMDALAEIRSQDQQVLMVNTSRTFADAEFLKKIRAASTQKSPQRLQDVLRAYEESGTCPEDLAASTLAQNSLTFASRSGYNPKNFLRMKDE